MDTVSSGWHHNYHGSASTIDLSAGFDSGVSYLRRSPDQYSSRGSMESLDPPLSSQLPPGAPHHIHLLHGHAGPHPTYSSCHQLSSARSSNSIDHLHSKRDSAYSSFSTSSSIPEYLASTPSFSAERSYSLETVPQRGGGGGGGRADTQQAEPRYVRTVYDNQQEHEMNSESRGGGGGGGGGGRLTPRDQQVGGVCYHDNGSSNDGANRHSVGSIWGHSSYESLKGAPAPPRRIDSYAAIRNHERPNSWSSLDHGRSLRSLHKGSWHHSSGSVASAKGSYGAEGQLHTVMEKSPESSPTTKPRQGGFPQPLAPPVPPAGPAGPPSAPPPGQPLFPTTVYCALQPELRYAHGPGCNPGSNPGPDPSLGPVSPAPGKQQQQAGPPGREDGAAEGVLRTGNGWPPQAWPSGSRAPDSQSGRWLDPSSSLSSDAVTYSHPAQGQTPPPPPQPRPAQGQTPPQSCPAQGQTPPPPQSGPVGGGDREHPLTRLENALAEVQQCGQPDAAAPPRVPARSLSVMEKISRFERREPGGKPRSHSTSTSQSKGGVLRVAEKGRSSPCGAEDLRHMLERSTRAQRTMSYRGGDQTKYRTAADPSLALQRSRSTVQVDAASSGDNKDFPWRQEVQELLGPVQDLNTNRTYRDRLKDVQSNVLSSTSFRRRDLGSSSSSSGPPPPSSSSSSSSLPHQPLTRFPSLEKKGPKTKPKPQGVLVPPQSAPSPHTPKERYPVSPEVRGPSPPPLPSIPPVGAPALTRICGRRRLTADQKKRSYSEPENMNEVGVSDAETVALFRRGGETSVADRRRMFERAASRDASRSDLRQVQQDALAEYVERKRAGGHRAGSRPRSAYLGPDGNSHADTLSLSSTSSLLSLQDGGLDRSLCPPDRLMLQSNLFYPGRVTTPRPPAQPLPGSPSGSSLELGDLLPESRLSRHVDLGADRWLQALEPPAVEPLAVEPLAERQLSQQLNGALQRTGSVSTENLLERWDRRATPPQHHRSRSSPTAETINQDAVPADVRMFDVFGAETGRCSDRPPDLHPSLHPPAVSPLPPSGAPPGQTPLPRRERQRHGERQRTLSTSTLAASVGLPCPFSPSGTGGGADWLPGARLNRVNLDDITFPPTGDGDGDVEDAHGRTPDPFRGRSFSLEAARGRPRAPPPPPPSHPPPPPPVPESGLFPPQPPTDPPTARRPQDDLDDVFLLSPAHPPPPPPATQDFPRPPSPLLLQPDVLSCSQTFHSGSWVPVSAPHLQSSPPVSAPHLQSSPPVSAPSLQSPSLESSPAVSAPSLQSPSLESSPAVSAPFLQSPSLESSPAVSAPSLQSSPAVSAPSLQSSPAVSAPSVQSSAAVRTPAASRSQQETQEERPALEYLPLGRREKTWEELRVEELTRRLVSLDFSLAPLLDDLGGKSTVDLMEEMFPHCQLGVKGQPQPADGGAGADSCEPLGRSVEEEEEEEDLTSRKLELVEALRSSLEVLRREKEALSEEQRLHQALGASVESLVQERLKPNERDKFSMFIGDLDRIVNLLLSLCGRLSRIDRALVRLQEAERPAEGAAEERESLLHKRSLLLRQTEDARELKENLERRQRTVHSILCGYLSEPRLRDYQRFVATKPRLLMARRRLDDLLRQEDERLARLLDSLPPGLAKLHGPAPTFTPGPAPTLLSNPTLCPSPLPGLPRPVRSAAVTSL